MKIVIFWSWCNVAGKTAEDPFELNNAFAITCSKSRLIIGSGLYHSGLSKVSYKSDLTNAPLGAFRRMIHILQSQQI